MPRYQDFEKRSVENLKKLLKRAQYDEMAITQILEEYHSFKSSVRALSNSSKDENDFIRLFEFTIFKQHECKDYVCDDHCSSKGKLETPKEPIGMKFLHLYLKEK